MTGVGTVTILLCFLHQAFLGSALPGAAVSMSTIDKLNEIILANRRAFEATLHSFSIRYVIATYGPPTDGHSVNGGFAELERRERFAYHFIYENGKWCEEVQNVHLIGPRGESYDNARKRVYNSIDRRTLYRKGLESKGTPALEGHIHRQGLLGGTMDYLLFLHCYRANDVFDYIREHREDIESLDVSQEGIELRMCDSKAKGKYWITIDPERNFNVTRKEYVDQEGNRSVTTVELAEVRHGLWIPQAGQIDTYLRDQEGLRLVRRIILEPVALDKVEIGKEYPDSVFEMVFEPGTRVTDFAAGGVTYTVGLTAGVEAIVEDLGRVLSEHDGSTPGETTGASSLRDVQEGLPAETGNSRNLGYGVKSGVAATVVYEWWSKRMIVMTGIVLLLFAAGSAYLWCRKGWQAPR